MLKLGLVPECPDHLIGTLQVAGYIFHILFQGGYHYLVLDSNLIPIVSIDWQIVYCPKTGVEGLSSAPRRALH